MLTELTVSSTGTEPITVALAKVNARFTRTVEDALFGELISAVRDRTERATRRSFLAHRQRVYFQRWFNAYEFERSTVDPASVEITYIPLGGSTPVALPSTNYKVMRGPASWIELKSPLPLISEDFGDSIRLEYTTVPEVPSPRLKRAMLGMIQHLWQNRSEYEVGPDSRINVIEIPDGWAQIVKEEQVGSSLHYQEYV